MSSPLRFAERGPHPVGVVEIEIHDPEDASRTLTTDVWYPARAGSDTDAPEAPHPLNRPHRAHEGLAPAAGRFPLVAFSHGNSGLRRQSTFLTTHLASWGVVVAANDHPGNTFFEMIQLRSEDERREVHFDARRNRPRDVGLVIDALLAGGAWPALAPERVGVLGHSFGGWTAAKMPARDPRVRAVCGLAPASEPFVGRKAFEPDELPFEPPLPVLLVAGVDDVLVDLETSVQPLFARMSEPRALVTVDASDHFHFCDGVELLHGMHAGNLRPNQPRPTKPYAEQLPEERIHRLLQATVTCFFHRSLVEADDDPCATLDPASLRAVDTALRRHDASAPSA
jgi:predicted dienelactone hydrolase